MLIFAPVKCGNISIINNNVFRGETHLAYRLFYHVALHKRHEIYTLGLCIADIKYVYAEGVDNRSISLHSLSGLNNIERVQ